MTTVAIVLFVWALIVVLPFIGWANQGPRRGNPPEKSSYSHEPLWYNNGDACFWAVVSRTTGTMFHADYIHSSWIPETGQCITWSSRRIRR